MAILGADHGADNRIFVRHPGQAGKMLANLDAGNVGGDGTELASNLAWRICLQVEHVLMRRPARQKNHDDRLMGASDSRGGFGPKELWQGQPAEAKRTNL
jgi:hypothetical protein